MIEKELENKIGFQIGFLLYSALSPKDVIEHLKQIAIDYAEQFKEKTNDYEEDSIR